MITYAPDKKEFCLKLGAIIAVGVIVIALAVIIGVVYLLGTKSKEKGKIERIKIVCETLRKTQKDPIIHKDEVESLLKNEIQEEIKKEIKNCIKGEKSHKQRKTAGKKIADFIKFFFGKGVIELNREEIYA